VRVCVCVGQRVMWHVPLAAVTAQPRHAMRAVTDGNLTALDCSARLAKVLFCFVLYPVELLAANVSVQLFALLAGCVDAQPQSAVKKS